MRLRLVVYFAVVLALGGAAFGGSSGKAPEPVVHRYKVMFGEGNGGTFEGTSIKSNGFCVEITLNGRLDTVVCGAKYVTEMLPESEATPAPQDGGQGQARR